MLTAEQCNEFNRVGIVRLPGAIASNAIEEMADCVWAAVERRWEVRRDDPRTWNAQRMTGFRDLPESLNFQRWASPALCDALDNLFGTRSWERPERRFSMLVAFPESSGRWDVPHQHWHLDYPAVRGLEGNFAVRLFVVLAKLNHAGGGTVFVAGSHRLVQSLVTANGGERIRSADARRALIRNSPWIKGLCSLDEKTDRVQRYMGAGTAIDGNEVRVIEMTGEPGDVVITHPLLLHAFSQNCSSDPRLVLSGSAYRDPAIANTIYGGDGN